MSNPFPTFLAALRRLLPWAPGGRSLRYDPLVVLRELSSMLRSGVPLPQALSYVADGFSVAVRDRLEGVRARVEAGEPLSAALATLPPSWAPDSLRALVEAGERSGRLPELLDDLAAEHERLLALDRRVRSFTLYPLVVLTLASLILWVLTCRMLPVYATLYEHLGATLPLVTRVVFGTVGWGSGWLLLLLLATLAYQLLTLGRPVRLAPLTRLGQRLAWRLPFVRGLRRALLEVRFARTLRLLLSAGVELPEALDRCRQVVADDRAGAALVDAAGRVRRGEAPSDALSGLGFLSPAFLWFLVGSEQRGDFVEVTGAMAAAAEEHFLTRAELLERVLEPVGTFALGLVVGSVILAAYLPVFGLIRLVGE